MKNDYFLRLSLISYQYLFIHFNSFASIFIYLNIYFWENSKTTFDFLHFELSYLMLYFRHKQEIYKN